MGGAGGAGCARSKPPWPVLKGGAPRGRGIRCPAAIRAIWRCPRVLAQTYISTAWRETDVHSAPAAPPPAGQPLPPPTLPGRLASHGCDGLVTRTAGPCGPLLTGSHLTGRPVDIDMRGRPPGHSPYRTHGDQPLHACVACRACRGIEWPKRAPAPPAGSPGCAAGPRPAVLHPGGGKMHTQGRDPQQRPTPGDPCVGLARQTGRLQEWRTGHLEAKEIYKMQISAVVCPNARNCV